MKQGRKDKAASAATTSIVTNAGVSISAGNKQYYPISYSNNNNNEYMEDRQENDNDDGEEEESIMVLNDGIIYGNSSDVGSKKSAIVCLEHKVTRCKIPVCCCCCCFSFQRIRIRPWNSFNSLEAPRHGTLENAQVILSRQQTTYNNNNGHVVVGSGGSGGGGVVVDLGRNRANSMMDAESDISIKNNVTIVTEKDRTTAGGFMTITILILCVISVMFGILNRVDPLTATLDKRNDSVNKRLTQFVMKYKMNVYDVICDPFSKKNSLSDQYYFSNENITYINVTKLSQSDTTVNYLITLSSLGYYFDGTEDMSLQVHRECFSILNLEPIAQLRQVMNQSYNSVDDYENVQFSDAESILHYYESAAIYTRNFRYSWNTTSYQLSDLVNIGITWYSLEPTVDVLTSNDIFSNYMHLITKNYPILNFTDGGTGQSHQYSSPLFVLESKDCFMFRTQNLINTNTSNNTSTNHTNTSNTNNNNNNNTNNTGNNNNNNGSGNNNNNMDIKKKYQMSDVITLRFNVDSTVKQRFYESQSARLARLPLNILASIGSIIALRSPATWLVLTILESLSGFFLLKSTIISIAVLIPSIMHLGIYAAQAIHDPVYFAQRTFFYNALIILNVIAIIIIFRGMLLWNMDFCSEWRRIDIFHLWSTFTQPMRMVKYGLRRLPHGIQKYMFALYFIIYLCSFLFNCALACGLIWIHWSCALISVILELFTIIVLHFIWKLYLCKAFCSTLPSHSPSSHHAYNDLDEFDPHYEYDIDNNNNNNNNRKYRTF